MTSCLSVCLLVALLVVVVPRCLCAFNLTILHTNDVHARYEQTNKYSSPCADKDVRRQACFGGYARLVTKVKEFRAKRPNNTLVLDAGDQYQGTYWFYVYGGNVTSTFMNWLGYDAMSFGNHEFDRNIVGLVDPFLKKINFPILSANLDSSKEPTMQGTYNKSTVLIRQGRKIGIVSYITPTTKGISHPGNLIFNPEIPAVQAEVNKLKREGVDIIIALGHSGFTMDKRIAQEVDGVDVVIGGHTNTFLYTGDPPSNEKPKGPYPLVFQKAGKDPVLVIEDYAYAKYLGHIELEFNDTGTLTSWSGNPILLDSTVTQDQNTLDMMEPWKQGVEVKAKEVLGSTNVFLQGDQEFCRRLECNMGNFITDGLVDFYMKKRGDAEQWSTVAIAIMNGGGIRSNIDPGDINMETLLTVQPFMNTIERIQLKGEHVLGALEHSVHAYSTDPNSDLFGGFLQMSGMKVVYDVSKPPQHRVVEVKVRCTKCDVPQFEPLNLTQIYDIILPDFTANGGDDYTVIKKNKIDTPKTGYMDSNVFRKYLEKMTPVTIGLEGRITFVDGTKKVCTSGEVSTSSTPSFIAFILICAVYLI
ncbi:5'-nucleotidase-like [Gigantopelta aegis]|uniref:5'-nucleotidase-like n=1 Tax=Gigantopelta aegis TaxID=1735272 RepID=UPI001B887757|nr:5'-nucleotidase-like [Gigantopelta aegis]